MILLYPANETEFKNNGLGALSDAISCIVTEERNGEFELEMEYPLDGIHFAELTDRCIITAIPSPYRLPQPFRVYQITKPLDGICTVYARHISYDLSGVPLNPFTAESAIGAMAGLEANAEGGSPFTFWTDKSTTAKFTVTVPSSTRSVLGGQAGSILDVYGGEYEWDGFTVKLQNTRGQDNGVVIRYGKNLTDLEQERNNANVSTGIYPYWADSDGNLVTCNPKIVPAPGTYDFSRVVPVDFSQDFDEKPTPEQLKEKAESYVQANNIGVPKVSITASFVQLEQTEEYKDFALLEKCDLCDIVTIQFERLGVDVKAKIVKIVTDVLNRRYQSVEIGDARTNIADTIAGQGDAIKDRPTNSEMDKAVNNATNWITGNKGGYVIFQRDATGQPVEVLIMDTPDINTAMQVWRWNKSGLGYSKNGYNGPYSTAITQDGAIVADFITAGTFNGNLIKVGRIQSHDGQVYFDLDQSELAASVLKGTGEDSKTVANIGKVVWSSGYVSQGFKLFYPEGKTGGLIVTLDGNTDYPDGNLTEFSSYGDILIRSNVAGSNGANNNSLKMNKDVAQGQGTIEINRADREGTTAILHADQNHTELSYISIDGKYTWVDLTADRISFGTDGMERGSLDKNGWHGQGTTNG